MDLVDYLFEVGELKRVKRSGWWLAKIKDPESVAEHSHRASILAFILAKMENVDPYKLCSAAVFHDVIEARLGDIHKVTARYVDITNEIEKKVIEEQLQNVPSEISSEIKKVILLEGKERDVLKDADLLECAIQAKEYLEIGHAACTIWMDNIGKQLKTRSAKDIFQEIKESKSSIWHQKISKK
ncbi:MAG TPA: HD domain-containing protein [Candidatus Bilamarchaeaceae archaeon]|nr:HD domain-containing protein [Candidatus Bilamarchaeaceae archaeon]